MEYTRRPGEKAYRRPKLYESRVSGFEAFKTDGEVVTFTEYKQVLEILREDGTTELINGDIAPLEIRYRFDGNWVWLSCPTNPSVLSTVTARMWIRKEGLDAVAYKVPNGLRIEGNECGFQVPAGINELVLFGDKYFDAVYQLTSR